MALAAYRAKRNFVRTAEPSGDPVESGVGDSFVVQKHAARRLHYDLRLELDGVLKSWAVTVGPSLVAGEKRLAVEVEDHPLAYATFEGDIPKGEYGGGNVIVWDRGHWIPQGDAHAGLAKGHLRFTLKGLKLGGDWDLVRMKRPSGEKHTPWLLIKVDDASARSAADPDILTEQPDSVLVAHRRAGRDGSLVTPEVSVAAKRSKPGSRSKAGSAATVEKPDVPAKQIDPGALSGAVKASLPAFVEPELAALTLIPPAGAEWIHEIKFDGYRLQARIDHRNVQLRTRSGLDWTEKFRALADAFRTMPVETALIDGEAVVETEQGHSSFSALQTDLKAGRSDRMAFYGFDLLHLNGFDLTKVPLLDRKHALRSLVPEAPGGPIRFSEHFTSDGSVLRNHACRLGLEGIVSKRGDKPYRSGRNSTWLKSKCSNRQEFIIVGYARSSTARQAIGAIALGYYDGGKLIFAGRAGTGFDTESATLIWQRLESIRRADTAVEVFPSESNIKDLRWAEPQLVAEIEFREWTDAGHVRHAVFQGLREDKKAADVRRETPVGAVAPSARRNWTVTLTHPDRLYWADVGISKHGLADYYAEIWDWISPHVVKRPLALVRCPGGTTDACFFQKHAWSGMDTKLVHADETGGQPYVWIDSFDGLIALVQAGALEIHAWGSTVENPDRPDLLCFDLDPAEEVSWERVEQAALKVRDTLSGLGLTSFLKTSGGKGLHVVLPLDGSTEWPRAKAFAKEVAERMARNEPDEFVAVMAKAKRRDKIFIDYLRNGRGSTAVAAFSTRARAGAPVSTPLAWHELGTGVTSRSFSVANLPRRLSVLRENDPWADMAGLRQTVPKKV